MNQYKEEEEEEEEEEDKDKDKDKEEDSGLYSEIFFCITHPLQQINFK